MVLLQHSTFRTKKKQIESQAQKSNKSSTKKQVITTKFFLNGWQFNVQEFRNFFIPMNWNKNLTFFLRNFKKRKVKKVFRTI